MNPFTQSLVLRLQDPRLAEFVRRWDELEGLVIRVYKAKSASMEDAYEHAGLRRWLLDEYPNWQTALAPYWPLALAAGKPLGEDPFTFLLAVLEAGGFVHHRAAMQTLPAARQALNQYLMDRLPEKGGSETVSGQAP